MRSLRLGLGERDAATTTTLVVDRPRDHLALHLPGIMQDIQTSKVQASELSGDVLRLEGVAAGARILVASRIPYSPRAHGLSRWVDPLDDLAYVVASGALGGAARFLAVEDGPDDRMPTRIAVSGAVGRTIATGDPVHSPGDEARRFASRIPLAGHQLALAAGPWRNLTDGHVRLLVRQSLVADDEFAALMADSRRALGWVAGWFGGLPPIGGAPYTQVLLPDPPWLAMEHPGCVLVSERLLEVRDEVDRARRVAVLAHEVAHQWFGNLVSPQRWSDVGVFEGLAELLGQLACEALLGRAGEAYLEQRRSAPPLVALPTAAAALTAGLAEVAGPVQHAELFRTARTELGAAAFRAKVLALCRARAGSTLTTAEAWAALGLEARTPTVVRLPMDTDSTGRHPVARWDRIGDLDPATAVRRVRAAFRASPSRTQERARAALVAIHDPRTPAAVTTALAAEVMRLLEPGSRPKAETKEIAGLKV